MTNELETPKKPTPKFKAGDTVYLIDRGNYGNAYGYVSLDGMDKRVKFTKATVKEVYQQTDTVGIGRKRHLVWKETVRLADQGYKTFPAAKTHIWTEAQYADVAEEYESKVKALTARKDAEETARRLFLTTLATALQAMTPDEAADFIDQGTVLTVTGSWASTCTTCWSNHSYLRGGAPDHEPTLVTYDRGGGVRF